MERTQIYLSSEQADALDREARRRGTTRSHLIREAIDQMYVVSPDRERVLAGLRAAAGSWKGWRESGEEYVDRIRATGRMARLSNREPDPPDEAAD